MGEVSDGKTAQHHDEHYTFFKAVRSEYPVSFPVRPVSILPAEVGVESSSDAQIDSVVFPCTTDECNSGV